MNEPIDIKEEPVWFGELPDDGEALELWPRRETFDYGDGGRVRPGQSAAVGATTVKREPDLDFVDVDAVAALDLGRGVDVDPLREPPAVSGLGVPPPEFHRIKRELPTPESTETEAGHSSHATHGMLSPPDFAFCSVVGTSPYADGCCKTEPAENGCDVITKDETSAFVASPTGVQVNAPERDASSQCPSQAVPSGVNQARGSGEYTCATCGEKTRSRKALERHLRLHGSGGGSRPNGRVHATVERGNTPSSALNRLQSEAKSFVCSTCGAGFATVLGLKRHGHTHGGVKAHACGVCGARFFRRSDLNVHARKHSGVKAYACSLCEARFATRSGLGRHGRVHGRQTVFTCDVCGARLSSRARLDLHRRVHGAEPTFACDGCGAKFPTASSLGAHGASSLAGDDALACGASDLVRPGRTRKRGRISNRKVGAAKPPSRSTTTTVGTLFPCDVCDAKFSTSSSVDIHRRSHEGAKPYDLARHTRKHGGANRFACEVCESTFLRKSELNVHKRSHTGAKPYGCDGCKAKFSTNSSLIRHKRTHTREKPFGCDTCPARFTTSHSLTIHTRLHSGDRPYVCVVCKTSFASNSGLSRHKKIHK